MTQCTQTKYCPRCRKEKSLEDFHRASARRDGRAGYCKPCALAAKREHWNRTKEIHIRDYERSLQRRYNISAEEYTKLCELQNYRCVICECDPRVEYAHMHEKAHRLHVDHCHETNRIRGLLCQRCNKRLGWTGDNPEFLRRVLAYVEGNLSPLRT